MRRKNSVLELGKSWQFERLQRPPPLYSLSASQHTFTIIMSAAVRLLILSLLGSASCNIHNNELQSLNQLKENKAPFKACIDDSDCTEQGADWACFQYICYPWKDDTKIDAKHRKRSCKTDSHCDNDLSCLRHFDRRNVRKGLCMEPVVDCSENGKSDCKNNGEGSNHVCRMNVILYFLNLITLEVG